MNMIELPDIRIRPLSPDNRVAVGKPRPSLTAEDVKAIQEEQKDKAKYKIEVMFSRHRSSLSHKPSHLMLLIWESGKRLHGGGDQKMYWCGYGDCAKPITSDDFGYMHVVCRHCQREMFLDPDARAAHVASLRRERRNSDGLDRLPCVVGEKMANLTPPNLAELLVKTWYALEGQADVYIKFSPYEIRYDKLHETTSDMDRLEKTRVQRQPVIYTLRAIRKDLASGADLKSRFVAMVTA
jgi:hypothetical protein